MTDSKSNVWRFPVVILVIVAVLAFHVYFFRLDLPNSGTVGNRVSRVDLWQVALGWTDLPAPASEALRRLADWTYLPQRLPVLGYAVLIVIAAIAAGSAIVRLLGLHPRVDFTPAESLVFAYGLGLSVLSLMTLGLGLAGWLLRPLVIAGLVCLAAAGAWQWWSRRRDTKASEPEHRKGAAVRTHASAKAHRRRSVESETRLGMTAAQWCAAAAGAVAVGLFLLISLLGAMLPATDFDVREYHLQGPKEFYLAHRIRFAPHNVYMNMPFGTEMISLLGMFVADDWWWGALVGQTVLATFAPMTGLGVWALARRLFGPAAGWLAALIYLTTPWVHRIAIIPYTENALCFYLLAATLAVSIGVRQQPACAWRSWLLAGVLAGTAAACKYTALTSTVLPLGIAAVACPLLRRLCDPTSQPLNISTVQPRPGRETLRIVSAFALGVAAAFGPWLAKNAALTGNPTYPLLYRVFGGRNWSESKNEKWEWGHRVSLLVALGVQHPPAGVVPSPRDPQHGITWKRLWENIRDVTAQDDRLSPLLFSLAPLALLRRSDRTRAIWLWVLALFLFMQWWFLTHRLDRFWVPLIPLVAVLAGAGATWTSLPIWRAVLITVVTLSIFFNFSYSTSGLCGDNRYSAALIERRDPIASSAVNYLNSQLPASAHLLSVGAADLFHLDREVVYNTVFDDVIFEQLVRDRTPDEVAAALGERGITHVYVSWAEIDRYRRPGSYGYSDFVTPAVFRDLVKAGVLERPIPLAPPIRMQWNDPVQEVFAQELYAVRATPSPSVGEDAQRTQRVHSH